MSVSAEKVRDILLDIVRVIDENKQYLTDLDAAIGDGDHGHNMARGFQVVKSKLEENPAVDVGDLLKVTAMALISHVGGASGPLYGTLFLKGSAVVKDKTELSLQDFSGVLKAGIEGVKARGKAELGEKTMLDVLIPVQESIEADAKAGTGGAQALAKAAKLAEECKDATKNIIATKGRASYLGERSIGHIDPGATSSWLMVLTVSKALEREE